MRRWKEMDMSDGDSLTRGLKSILEEGNRALKIVSPTRERELKQVLDGMGGERFLGWLELLGVASSQEIKTLLQEEPSAVTLAATDSGRAAMKEWQQRHRAEIGRCRRIIGTLMESRSPGSPKAMSGGRRGLEQDAGKKSALVFFNRVGQCLHHLDDRWALSRNPLARLDAVDRLAREKYPGHLMPRGLALRDLLRQCVEEAIREADNAPGLHRAGQYLRLAAKGLTGTEISRELHLSREHVSRTYRRRALELVADRLNSLLAGLA